MPVAKSGNSVCGRRAANMTDGGAKYLRLFCGPRQGGNSAAKRGDIAGV
jgi:hypothetical protein